MVTKIAIVDENDQIIGAAERAVARTKGLRHRIARIFILNSAGKILLQQRNLKLLDNPGKWDQSAGGHVDEGESYLTAARRETFEELGIKAADFTEIGKFYIEREAPGGIVRRFQTIFTAQWDGVIAFDEAEVAAVDWFTLAEIDTWITAKPEDFTTNFASAFKFLQTALTAN